MSGGELTPHAPRIVLRGCLQMHTRFVLRGGMISPIDTPYRFKAGEIFLVFDNAKTANLGVLHIIFADSYANHTG